MNTNIAERMQELANDQIFAEKIQAAASELELMSILEEYGIHATENDLVQFLSGFDSDDGELSEDMLDNVAGGGKFWDWVKDRFGRWFKKRSEKNTKDINKMMSNMFK